MRLLGNFPSQLNSTHYADLLALIKDQIASGEYQGGTSFDASAITTLQEQGKDFSSLPVASAGSRAIDDSINTPINLLKPRYDALASEVAYFALQADSMTAALQKEVGLLDQLLAYTDAVSWSSRIPKLVSSESFAWNFEGGYSAISADIAPSDPEDGVVYKTVPAQSSVLNTVDGKYHSGISPAVQPRIFSPKNLTWSFSTEGEAEIYSGADWAELGVLETQPKLTFSEHPTVQPLEAANLFTIKGSVPGGIVPIYVNLLFIPRSSTKVVRMHHGDTVLLTPYRVQQENTDVDVNGTSYIYGTDFTVTSDGYLTSVSLPEDKDLEIRFDEYFPAYQCSVNQENWSPIIMLDPNRPYPDDTVDYVSLGVRNNEFPLTDESGVPTGLYMTMQGVPQNEMIFSVTTPAAPIYGMAADLRIDMERPAYMTGLHLSPYTSYPQILKKITCQSVTGSPVVLFNGTAIIDRPMTLTFPRISVRSLTLSFVQENYTIKQYAVDQPDKLRRDTLASLQSILPFAIRTFSQSTPNEYQGAQYQFGFEDIQGVDWSNTTVPSVFVTGPYRATGIPEAFRLDAVLHETVDAWVYFKSYTEDGNLVYANTGVQVTPGTTLPMSFPGGTDRSQIAYSDFYLKFILRTSDSRVERFFLQVAHV